MLIAEAIGIGLVMSLLFTEAVGFAAGGFVVPGYIALYLDKPMQVGATIAAALVTYLAVKLAGKLFLLYGRRTLVLAVLVGFLFGGLASRIPLLGLSALSGGVAAIGYIIPGLLAYWMTRQGILQTLAAMGVAAVVVRLTLIALHGGALLETISL